MRLRVVAAAAALIAAATACTSSPDPTPTPTSTSRTDRAVVYPDAEWQRSSPEPAGFDAGKLERIDGTLGAARSTCFVVTRHGKVVHEQYWRRSDDSTRKPVFSVTKSVTSTLIGIAVDEGKLSLDDKAADYIPSWRETESRDVTIRNLLSNDSGRHWDFETDYFGMAGPRTFDRTAFAIALGQDAEPGTVWAYNNSAIQALSAILLKATGEEPAAYAARHLFGPLGMYDTTWIPDRAGHTSTYAGISSTCLDLARFGYLALNRGDWDGERVVSSAYIADATGRSSTTLNAAYGLLWWVNRPGTVLGALTASGSPGADEPYTGRLAPRAPADTFWALGYAKQVVAVVPSEGIVAVRMGLMPTSPDAITPDNFTGAVLDALS